ncbi:hypothetical protein TWF718_009311 [Orbilia javanica]|uniref:Uncharacterized protein n=1 Tax=Orbilia javanica TaxID=47235 RepID=A0AAN8RME4_9PEZI
MCMYPSEASNVQDLDFGHAEGAESLNISEDDDTTVTQVEESSTVASASTAATSIHTWDDPSFEEYCYRDDEDGDGKEHCKQAHKTIDQHSPSPSIEPLRPRQVRVLRRAIGSSNLKSQPTYQFAAAEPMDPYKEGLQWSVKRNRRLW